VNIEIAPSGPAQFSIIRKSPEELLDESVVAVTYKLQNWPVVYLLDNSRKIYVGESVNFLHRYRQHSLNPSKNKLDQIRVILDDSFNKSACHDLESNLIRYFASDTKYEVINRNLGLVDVNYFNRDAYRERFKEIYRQLQKEGLFDLSFEEIENSDTYKLSPYTTLNDGQSDVTERVISAVVASVKSAAKRTLIIEGGAGTGKSVLLTYLAKLLVDANEDQQEIDEIDEYGPWTDMIGLGDAIKSRGRELKVAVVIPQQSFRATVKKAFESIPGLQNLPIFSPLDIANCDDHFDVALIDEGHRLRKRASHMMGVYNTLISQINIKLYGFDDYSKTEMDWMTEKSDIQITFMDPTQRVRPSDLSLEYQSSMIEKAKANKANFLLLKQERLGTGGAKYLEHLQKVLVPTPSRESRQKLIGYDLRIYCDLAKMIEDLNRLEMSNGRCRLTSGFGYKHLSKRDSKLFDIKIDGIHLKWNRKQTDWIESVIGCDEVGSIHTVQGYDLNYAGVIFAPEIAFDPTSYQFRFIKENYHDRKSKENNNFLNESYDDRYHLDLVLNIYKVLLSRGTLGTFIYCVDNGVRNFLLEAFYMEITQ
ncbi:unnamed protein product, partial [Acidithrix sp. C25]